MAFTTVATVAELPDGERIVVDLDNHWVAIFNVGNRLYAVEDLCTHDDGPLAEGYLTGLNIECPRHGAVFNLETGKATFPAVKPVPRYPVQIVGEAIQVDVAHPL